MSSPRETATATLADQAAAATVATAASFKLGRGVAEALQVLVDQHPDVSEVMRHCMKDDTRTGESDGRLVIANVPPTVCYANMQRRNHAAASLTFTPTS